MGRCARLTNTADLFDNYSDIDFHGSWQDGFEKYLRWPEKTGHGFMYTIKLREGLFLGIGDYLLKEHIRVDFTFDCSSVFFGFTFQGNLNVDFSHGKDQRLPHQFHPGYSFIGYIPKWQGVAEYPPGVPIRSVGIYIAPLLLKQILMIQGAQPLSRVDEIVHAGENGLYCQAFSMTNCMRAAVHQILNCPYALPLKRVYLEGKALELISHTMIDLIPSSSDEAGYGELQPEDLERIHQAEKVLTQNLDEPPTLSELARCVGLNKNKLNRGFHQIFGTSAYNHLRVLRLEKARDLLETRQKSVTETAFDVGYNHQQNFSRAFKNYFGTTPKDHIR